VQRLATGVTETGSSSLNKSDGTGVGVKKDENIAIAGGRFIIRGVNEGSRDAVTLKLTFNV